MISWVKKITTTKANVKSFSLNQETFFVMLWVCSLTPLVHFMGIIMLSSSAMEFAKI